MLWACFSTKMAGRLVKLHSLLNHLKYKKSEMTGTEENNVYFALAHNEEHGKEGKIPEIT